MRLNEVYRNSGLGKWFHGESATKEPGWDRYNSEGKRVGKCGDAKEGSAYSACLSKQKAEKLGKEGRASFVNRKRAAQNQAGRGEKGTGKKGKKPINVDTGASKMEECYECEQEIILEGKNKPNDPEKWSACKSAAKSKFDVYPSAYANAWAAKCYKKKGGTWRSLKEETILDKTRENTKLNILNNFMENAKPEFARRGPAHQRPKVIPRRGKGKAGTEKKQERREGKKEAQQGMYEAVSIHNPSPAKPNTESPKPQVPDKKPQQSGEHEKFTGMSDVSTSGQHSTQLRIFRSLIPKYTNPNTEGMREMGAESSINTQDTPKNTDMSAYTSQLLDQDRVIANLRYKFSDLQSRLNADKTEAATRRAAEKKAKEEGPDLFHGL
jgi:hypothetical protein